MPDIYIMRTACARGTVLPPERQSYINSAPNAQTGAQRLAAWTALTKGTAHSFPQIKDPGFFRDAAGIWRCNTDGIFFSLSHSGDYAAAAVSCETVGLDIEVEAALNSKSEETKNALLLRCGTEKEQSIYSPGNFGVLWTKKESIFKFSGEKSFFPAKIESSLYPVKSYRCGNLLISVCSKQGDNRFFSADGEYIIPLEAEEIK